MILLKALLILFLIVSMLSFALIVTLIIGVRYFGWELHLAYREEDEDENEDNI